MYLNTQISLLEKGMGGRNQVSKSFLEGHTSQPEKVMLHSSTQIFISDDLGAQPGEATKQYEVVFTYNSK